MGRRDAWRIRQRLAEELRGARLAAGVSQGHVARIAGTSQSEVSRLELAQADRATFGDVARVCAVLGLRLDVRTFPAGSPVRDAGQLRLVDRFRPDVHESFGWATEVPLPNPGDRRAWDALVRIAAVRIGVEAETRARDSQALERRLKQKWRDGGVDHVILLLSDTRHNRAFLRAAGEGFRGSFPLSGRTILERLAASTDPGGSGIVLL